MALLQDWQALAYNQETDKKELQKFWQDYFLKEKDIYAQLLKNPDEAVKGSIKELAEKYGVTVMEMTGFLDGIQESLKEPNNFDDLTENSEVSLDFDNEKLYRNMVEAKADWLYDLPEWDDIFSKEKREELYKEQKQSHTFVREGKKIGRNDPCPCGSGKKYKNCCGKDI